MLASLIVLLFMAFFPIQHETMLRVGGCESWGDPLAIPNPSAQNPKSSAAGSLQIIRGTWEWARKSGDLPVQRFEQGRYHIVQQLIVGQWLVREGGGIYAHWRWSAACWEP